MERKVSSIFTRTLRMIFSLTFVRWRIWTRGGGGGVHIHQRIWTGAGVPNLEGFKSARTPVPRAQTQQAKKNLHQAFLLLLLPTDGEKESKCTRKKRKTPQTHAENKTRKVMKTVTDQGERIAGVMEKLQEAQTKKMDMMTKIYGSHA